MSMFRTDSVELESGEVFRVRELSAKQRNQMFERTDMLERQCLAVVYGVVGDDGSQKFKDPAELQDWPARVMDKLSMKILEMSGLLEKKANSTEIDDSSLD